MKQHAHTIIRLLGTIALAVAAVEITTIARAEKPVQVKSSGNAQIGVVKLPSSVGGVGIGLVKLAPKK